MMTGVAGKWVVFYWVDNNSVTLTCILVILIHIHF